MDLFDYGKKDKAKQKAPLAVRMRPKTLEEFEGQEHIVGEGKLLRQAIEADKLQSIILYGPPGSGKTTLAHIIANLTNSNFKIINAVMAGVKDIRKVVDEAKEELKFYGQSTIVFIDEIHRFNKSQQDALLPFVEDGLITLIGATTENPMFNVNKALISRSRVFSLEPLAETAIVRLIEKAIKDKERGLGTYNVELTDEAKDHFVNVASGDVRKALNALEVAVLATVPNRDGVRIISLETAEDAIQKRNINYTKDGDEHYDVISAFIKSVRGSDPDAAVYWLARMLYAGEDINFITRRLIILAAEDIGLADPQALVLANSCAQTVERIGMPEARIILAETTIYLALAPKSNSAYLAINKAMAEVERGKTGNVPNHLREGGGGTRELLGHGSGYKYPHDFEHHWTKQDYLPDEVREAIFYEPVKQGLERDLVCNWSEKKGVKTPSWCNK